MYSWETGGNGGDLYLAQLLEEMDPFHHLVTYEDANAQAQNWFNLSQWGFASVECYGGVEAHHNMSLAGYRGKPVCFRCFSFLFVSFFFLFFTCMELTYPIFVKVYMAEGHMLWHSFWETSERNVVSAAWAVTTAAASFSWDDMGKYRITGPYNASQAFTTYPSASKSIDILANIMVNETEFKKLVPADELLGPHNSRPALTFCLADRGDQYVVYSDSGQGFSLDTHPPGGGNGDSKSGVQYTVTWFDAVEGSRTMGDTFVGGGVVKLDPPSTSTHWVLVATAQRH